MLVLKPPAHVGEHEKVLIQIKKIRTVAVWSLKVLIVAVFIILLHLSVFSKEKL
jgi:hypothetical protein